MTDKNKTARHLPKRPGNMATDCSGSTAIEYALIAGGLSIVIVASVNGVGSEVVNLFTAVADIF